MNFVEAVNGKAAGEQRFKVLYLDDEAGNVAFMQKLFTTDAIDTFIKHNPGVLTANQIELLKSVDLVSVLNDPDKCDLAKDQKNPGTADTQKYADFEKNQTPLTKEIRNIYDGKYDAVITDMNMPAHSEATREKYGSGGLQIANVARLANVPVLVHSLSQGDTIREIITESSVFGKASERHKAFSQSVLTPKKKDEEKIYLMLASVLEELSKKQSAAIAC